MNLKGNELGEAGWCAVFDALRNSPQNKIAKWDLEEQGISPTIAKSLVAYAASSDSLLEVNAGRLRNSVSTLFLCLFPA